MHLYRTEFLFSLQHIFAILVADNCQVGQHGIQLQLGVCDIFTLKNSNLTNHNKIDEMYVLYDTGDPTGYHVIIVNDLVMTGGTLIECAKV